MGNTDYQFIHCEKKDKLLWVTIDRPQVLNALHPPAHAELERAFDGFQNDSSLWVAILTGAGKKAFCVGNDLKYQAEQGGAKPIMPRSGFGGITRRFDCCKPIIAAVNGIALGGGLEIALACDIIISAEHAAFGLPEPRVGMIAATGIHRLARHIPYHTAMSLILTGRRIPSHEAYRIGIVSQVVSLEKLQATVEEWAQTILECAPLSVQASKQTVQLGLEKKLEEALATVYPLEETMRESKDYLEGPRAFVEKRKPNWKGC